MLLCYRILSIIFLMFTIEFYGQNIDGVWTQERGPYGTDTLIIANDKLYQSFIRKLGGERRRIYSDIIECDYHIGKIKYQVNKTEEGDSLIAKKHYIRFMIFELSEDELWTYSDSVDFPKRQYLKIHAYRNSWKSNDFKKYYDYFYKKNNECNDSIIFETYYFQADKNNLNFVTINPVYQDGDEALQKYFDDNLILKENLEDYFGIINIVATIQCDGSISNVYSTDTMINNTFPLTVKSLKDLLEKTTNWSPGYSNYQKVPCKIRIKFIVRDGKLLVDYK